MFRRLKGPGNADDRSDGGSERAVSPIVGIILLFGMVFVGAALLAVAGTAVMDSLETQSTTEQAVTCLDKTDHNVQTLLYSNDRRSVPCGADFDERGNVTLRFWSDDGSSETITIEPLGAFEQDVDGATLGYQSGGVFEIDGSSPTVHTAPAVGFTDPATTSLENQSLELNFVSVSEGSSGGSGDVMQFDRSQSKSLSTDIEAALDNGYQHMEIEIESEYHEAWAAHLEAAFHADAYGNVTVSHDRSAGTVTTTILDLADPEPFFEVTDVDPDDWMVPYKGGSAFETGVDVTNGGQRNGNDTVTLEIPSAADGNRSTAVDNVSPGETKQTTFTVDWDDISTSGPGNSPIHLDQYREYNYTVATSDTEATGSFYLTFPDESFYRMDGIRTTTNESTTTIAVNVTNIGEHDDPVQTTLTLQSDDDTLPDPIATWDETVRTDSWDDSTIEFDINRSALPDANYTFTVDVQNDGQGTALCNSAPEACTRDGTFEIEDGAIGDPGEVIITEPSNVSVSILGTEISAEGYSSTWNGYYKRWAPVTASAVVGDTRYRFLPNGSVTEIDYDDPHDTPPGAEMEDYNLNTFGSQETIYSVDEQITEGSVTIEATYWACDAGWWGDTGDWEEVGTDTWNGREYHHWECGDFGDPTTVDVASGSVDADSGFVMTRDSQRNELPDIEEGYPRQRSVQEVFEDGTDDIELDDGELTLARNDFAFMLETTMDQSGLIDEYEHAYDGPYDLHSDNRSELNLAAWDVAENYRERSESNTNDPNFNDVIGLVQVDGGGEYVALNPDMILDDYRVDGVSGEPTIEYSDDEYDDESPTVDAGTGAVVIS